MKLRILKGINNIGNQLLEISTEQARIIVGFGDELGTGVIADKFNPMIEGVTCGKPSCDGVLILRNPENCNLVNYVLNEVPIFLEQKVKEKYNVCAAFWKYTKKHNINDIPNEKILVIKDLEITYMVADFANANSTLLLIKSCDESILISGDFRNFDAKYGSEKLREYIKTIEKVDYWFIDGKYIGKMGPENVTAAEMTSELKNIMKFYKQVFVIHSETDLAISKIIYDVAMKTRKIVIQNTFLANLTTLGGSSPSPVSDNKVYAYSPLVLDNQSFEFKKKYVTHFYIHNAYNKMKKEKYVMNIDPQMIQDIQVFQKEELMNDACVIVAMNKNLIKSDSELETLVEFVKDLDLDYYEIYFVGRVNVDLINNMVMGLKPKNVIPIDFDPIEGTANNIYNFKVLAENEVIED